MLCHTPCASFSRLCRTPQAAAVGCGEQQHLVALARFVVNLAVDCEGQITGQMTIFFFFLLCWRLSDPLHSAPDTWGSGCVWVSRKFDEGCHWHRLAELLFWAAGVIPSPAHARGGVNLLLCIYILRFVLCVSVFSCTTVCSFNGRWWLFRGRQRGSW